MSKESLIKIFQCLNSNNGHCQLHDKRNAKQKYFFKVRVSLESWLPASRGGGKSDFGTPFPYTHMHVGFISVIKDHKVKIMFITPLEQRKAWSVTEIILGLKMTQL